MNLTPGQSHEAYIGPPSEPIKVLDFLGSAQELEEGSKGSPIPIFSQSSSALSEDIRESWSSLPQDVREEIQLECRCVSSLGPFRAEHQPHYSHSSHASTCN